MEKLFIKLRKFVITVSMLFYRRFKEKPMVLCVGDSWFNLTVFNFKKLPIDTIDWLRKYDLNIVDAAIPGYTLRKEMDYKLYKPFLKHSNQQHNLILLSLGGNDMVYKILDDVIEGEGVYAKVNKVEMKKRVKEFVNQYRIYISTIRYEFNRMDKSVLFVINGYDYVRAEEEFFCWPGSITKQMQKRNIPDKHANLLVADALNIYNSELKLYAEADPGVRYVDLRNTLKGNDWLEDMHPSPDGYKKLANKIDDVIKETVPGYYYSKQ